MKLLKICEAALIFCFTAFSVDAQNNVLQIFTDNKYEPIDWTDIREIRYDEGSESLIVLNHDNNDTKINISDSLSFVSGPAVPLIEIFTDEFIEEVQSKVNYAPGQFRLNAFGEFDDIDEPVNIRGRGNSSWGFPKKPYRLKFDKKISLCGLPAAKNYVLLANYMDCSLLQNALAFKIGELLELPYTNQSVPVEVKLNGIYKGAYIITNKPGINAGSVDIDESQSIMWELDVSYDEDLKFMSPQWNLPVMVADPDLSDEEFEEWKQDFIEMEKAAYQRRASQYVDFEYAAKYLLVNEIMGNSEIGYPKSVKLFKTRGQKYIFGPIWDFDVCMGKVWLDKCYSKDQINDKVWRNTLLLFLERDASFPPIFKSYLLEIYHQLPTLLTFIDTQSAKIRESALRNLTIYPDYEDFDESVAKMKEWLTLRFEALLNLYDLIPEPKPETETEPNADSEPEIEQTLD